MALLLAITSWQFTGPAVIGIDESWQAALHLSGSHGLQFGVDILFTYGPLGFLGFPHPAYGPSSALAFVATTVVYAGLAFAILWHALRVLPVVVAIAAVALVSRLSLGLPAFETALALVFIVCISALAASERGGRRWMAFVIAAGAVAGFGMLGKVNVGLFGGAALAATSVALSRPLLKGVALFLASALVAFAAAWLITGQNPGNFGAYVASSLEIIRGYAEAMVVDTHPTNQWTYLAFAACTVILVWLGWRASPGWPLSQRVGLLLVGGLLMASQWKTAFTRNELGYAFTTMALVAVPLAAMALQRRGEDRHEASIAPSAATLAVAALGMVAVATAHLEPIDFMNPYHPARGWASDAFNVLIPGRLDRAVAEDRNKLVEDVGLDGEVLAAIGSSSVHIDPWQTIVAAAHPELAWAPLPVPQAYSAYTPQLDGANAERLRSDAAPERILRERVDDNSGQPLAVDQRFVWFESPATTLEMVCRYEELAATDRWQVLGRTDRTCGEREELGSTTARAGEAVEVPTAEADRLVLVAIHGLEPSLVARLESLVHRAPEWYVDLGEGRGEFRLVPGTAATGLLLSVPPANRYSERFAFGPPVRTLAVTRGRDADPTPDLTYEFFSVLPPEADSGATLSKSLEDYPISKSQDTRP